MRPIYTAFYTRGTLYEQEAARLQASLIRHGLDFDIRPIESRGDWAANANYTATHILNVMRDYPDRPIVQLDADAVAWSYPDLFDGFHCVDIAVHYRQGHELLNGTLWIGPTDGAKAVIRRYAEIVAAQGAKCVNEQAALASAIDESSDFLRLQKLPASYCWIHDIMAGDLKNAEKPVIEHLQASRESSKSPALPNRRKRLTEIDGYLVG